MDAPRISGSLTLSHKISGNLSGSGKISGSIQIQPTPSIEPYTGQTEVDPDFVGTTLETSHKLVLSDITVNPIQVESVSNPYGGRTVYIGGII